VALLGHAVMSDLSPLSGVERKSRSRAGRTAFDPERTFKKAMDVCSTGGVAHSPRPLKRQRDPLAFRRFVKSRSRSLIRSTHNCWRLPGAIARGQDRRCFGLRPVEPHGQIDQVVRGWQPVRLLLCARRSGATNIGHGLIAAGIALAIIAATNGIIRPLDQYSRIADHCHNLAPVAE
jgi:Flp pilus assembly pilin Flp